MYDPNLPTDFGYRDGEQPPNARLKPCPFCGSAPDTFEDGEIQCSNKKCPVRPSAKWGGVEVWNTRISPASTAPVVEKDLNPSKNAAFEVWWKGQIARDFVHAALSELEKVSGPKLVAGQGGFAVEATAVSAARRSLDSALSTLDSAKSMIVTATQSQPLQCVRCKHYAETDPRGRCISVYYDAAGSLVYCGCKCKFPATATAAPQSECPVCLGKHHGYDEDGYAESCPNGVVLDAAAPVEQSDDPQSTPGKQVNQND